MGFFTSKKNINSVVTSTLVYENSKVKPVEVQMLFDKIGAVYDDVENQLTIMTINIEIMRYALQKSNAKELVNNVIESSYNRFYNSLRVGNEQLEQYKSIIDNVRNKTNEILFLKLFKS